MIRMRSTGSQKKNHSKNSNNEGSCHNRNNHNNSSSNSSNNNSPSLNSFRNRKSMKDSSNETDEDDDLRSLLSGNSLGETRTAHNPHTHRQLQHQQQGQGHQQGHITHLPSFDDDNSIMSALSNSQRGRSNSSQTGNNNNNSNNNICTNSKKVLWILGTIILAVGFLGPSGLLWDILDGDDLNITDDSRGLFSFGNNHHGDNHHHLSPPPPSKLDTEDVDENVHPMTRSAHAIDRATGTKGYTKNGHTKHGEFGSTKKKRESRYKKNNKKKTTKRGDKGGGGWGIKEAIDNIDKVFMDNRPVPAAGTTTTKKKKKAPRGEEEHDDIPGDDAYTEEEFLPVIHYSDASPDAHLDANSDALDTYQYTQLPASDALECRASVVAFVINATDVRDECDGLRKAFDKTCSVGHGKDGGGGATQQVQTQGGGGGSAGSGSGRSVGSGGSGASGAAGAGDQRRRRLSEWGRPHLWNLIPAAFEREMQKAGGKMKSHFQTRVRRRLSDSGHEHNRTLHETSHDSHHHHHSGGSSMGERKTEEVVAEEQPVQQQQKQEQHSISLNIPTADKHISEEMLNDALMLQESSDPKPLTKAASVTSEDTQSQQQQQQSEQHETNQDPDAPNQTTHVHDHPSTQEYHHDNTPPQTPPPLNNNPNITAESNEAVQDAAESAFAIRTAVETVKNSMSDAKSVEARTCCASILSVFHEHCDPTTTGVEDYSDRRLLVVVFVITVCGMVKSLIRHLGIRWLPEAGGCILVGVFGYLIMQHMPHVQFAFDGDMFLRIMVPPIVFEAAVKINKSAFRRHVIPICIFAIVGTLASTAFTAFILHKGSELLGRYVSTIPVRESLIFGALISSIDPIAVLSILNTMGMNDTDTIYVLIFGESLLNDGVAIVLFQTLVHFLDESLVIDSDVVLDAFMHFVVVALGSVTVGALSGACATVYFALMHGISTPMVEVIMFCCWSFIPYYICDMVEWSGIVAIVANGFVMDLYVIGQKHHHQQNGSSSSSGVDDEIDFLVNGTGGNNSGGRARNNRGIFNYEGHLSPKADSHVHFVIEIFATLMETAIFAYLGLFLFSPRYHWSGYLTFISIFATVMGRVMMIPLFSTIANFFNRMSLSSRNPRISSSSSVSSLPINNNEGVHIDRRMQLVLVFAGLRGAMSFALVEHIPMFDTTTGQGSRFKPELKAMTSASVIFTVFVLGGATSYLMERLGYSLNKQQHDTLEITPLVHQRKSPAAKRNGMFSSANDTHSRSNSSVRQRGGPR